MNFHFSTLFFFFSPPNLCVCFLGEQPSVNLGGFEKVLETERDFFFYFFFNLVIEIIFTDPSAATCHF